MGRDRSRLLQRLAVAFFNLTLSNYGDIIGVDDRKAEGIMDTTLTKEMKLGALAAAAGVSPRTVRLYIAKGVLPGPVRAGRGAAYTLAHLERIRRIQAWQAQGATLAEIRLRLAEDGKAKQPPQPVPWWRYAVTPDVEVIVRGDLDGWRLKRVLRGIAVFAEHLDEEQERDTGHENTDNNT